MTRMATCLQLFEKMQGAKLKAHSAVNKVYYKYRDQYADWRQSQEAYQLIEKQLKKLGGICPVCNDDLSLRDSTIDHLEAKRKNISKTLKQNNMLVMCRDCNLNKGSKSFHHWRGHLHVTRQQSLDYAITQIHGKARLNELLNAVN